jgi:hypothetical protein
MNNEQLAMKNIEVRIQNTEMKLMIRYTTRNFKL